MVRLSEERERKEKEKKKRKREEKKKRQLSCTILEGPKIEEISLSLWAKLSCPPKHIRTTHLGQINMIVCAIFIPLYLLGELS